MDLVNILDSAKGIIFDENGVRENIIFWTVNGVAGATSVGIVLYCLFGHYREGGKSFYEIEREKDRLEKGGIGFNYEIEREKDRLEK